MPDKEIKARKKLISNYIGSSNPEFDTMFDDIRKDVEDTFPNSCIVGARMSEDNTSRCSQY